jgi:hypothetical protein
MKKRFIASYRRNELYVVSTVIAVVFVAAMVLVAWMLQTSIVTPPYEALGDSDLRQVFATGYLRHREDDGSPYLKVEIHNGTLWWLKRVEFEFDGVPYTLRDSDVFRPLHFAALRCNLQKSPSGSDQIEYDLKITAAAGYPPAAVQEEKLARKMAGQKVSQGTQN